MIFVEQNKLNSWDQVPLEGHGFLRGPKGEPGRSHSVILSCLGACGRRLWLPLSGLLPTVTLPAHIHSHSQSSYSKIPNTADIHIHGHRETQLKRKMHMCIPT